MLRTDCSSGAFRPARVDLAPHAAALGMRFYSGQQFPSTYDQPLLITRSFPCLLAVTINQYSSLSTDRGIDCTETALRSGQLGNLSDKSKFVAVLYDSHKVSRHNTSALPRIFSRTVLLL